MIAPTHNPSCVEAELYYYDFLHNESRELIPESIVNHMERCQHCQEQIDQLKVVLSRTDGIEAEQGQVSAAITTMLQLHFAYIGKPVICNTVRPFLPGLLDPALKIRIPTPITAHLDNCRQCAEDLETIQRLSLDRKQLCRLSQLFAEEPGEDNISCSQAKAAIIAVVFMALHETNEGVLKHLCTCPDCRNTLYQYRQNILTDLLYCEKAPKEFPCEEVSATNIFDYCLPYGIDPAADQYDKFRESFTSHLNGCPICLGKIQELHNTLYGIAERLESEVVTIYHIDKSAKAQTLGESDDLYAGFPISVEIASRKDKVDVEQPLPSIDLTTALKRRVSSMNLKSLLKAGIAVTAVILIGLALLLNTPTAKAVTIDQIYKAIENVKNVYISSFVPDKTEPTQERWVSRTLNIYMLKTGKELVLWDLANKLRKTKQLDTDSVETTSLSEDLIIDINKRISGSLGIMPFYDMPEIPTGSEWHRVDDAILEVAEGIEIYDLKWTETTYGSSVFKKWRFSVDPKANLPQRIEIYRKSSADSEYNFISVIVVEFLSGSEIQKVKDVSF
jgi:hypothetical protein